MELTNEFSVAAPVEQAWATLLDIERIAPCMPGAALTSYDGEAFTGTVKVKLGPVNLTYAGKGRFVSKDDTAHRIVIEASGKDKRGTATAAATITGTLHPEGESTRVHVVTDLRITGAPAQFGRGMIADVAGRLVGQFADCLAQEIAATPRPMAEPVTEPVAEPVTEPVAEPEPAPKASEAEPIDLLAVTGTSSAARRAAPYVLSFLAGAAVGALITRVLS